MHAHRIRESHISARGQETYGEDLFLTARMAAASVTGMIRAKPFASLARRLIFSKASRFIWSFICEYFLKTFASPCRGNCVTTRQRVFLSRCMDTALELIRIPGRPDDYR